LTIFSVFSLCLLLLSACSSEEPSPVTEQVSLPAEISNAVVYKSAGIITGLGVGVLINNGKEIVVHSFEIQPGKGEQLEGKSNIYNAASIQSSIGPRP
jgi:hypothetical protein